MPWNKCWGPFACVMCQTPTDEQRWGIPLCSDACEVFARLKFRRGQLIFFQPVNKPHVAWVGWAGENNG